MPYLDPDEWFRATNAPTHELYNARREFLAAQKNHDEHMPAGFPLHVDSASVWSGTSLDVNKITYNLTSVDVEEIKGALRMFKGKSSHVPIGYIAMLVDILKTTNFR